MRTTALRFFFLQVVRVLFALKETRFSKHPICDVGLRITKSCSRETSTVRSVLDCLTRCNLNDACVGSSVSNSNVCFIHETCHEITDCTQVSNDHSYYSKNCQNGGTWNWRKNSCDCVDGWVGVQCLHLPKSCDDLIYYGYANDLHEVTLDLSDHGLPNTTVQCQIKGDNPAYSLVMLMKNSGRTSFDKTWDSYRSGFKTNSEHFWLGLEHWHNLNRAGYTTLTLKSYWFMSSVTSYEWNYYNFTLAGESEKYAFSFDTAEVVISGAAEAASVGAMGDCLETLQGVPFSTWNMDSDTAPGESCADTIGSGWWYTSCDAPCNLLGYNIGYQTLVTPERLIHIVGVNMTQYGNLMPVEIHYKTPESP